MKSSDRCDLWIFCTRRSFIISPSFSIHLHKFAYLDRHMIKHNYFSILIGFQFLSLWNCSSHLDVVFLYLYMILFIFLKVKSLNFFKRDHKSFSTIWYLFMPTTIPSFNCCLCPITLFNCLFHVLKLPKSGCSHVKTHID